MVQVSKQGSTTSTITESGRVLGPITRGRLLRAGVKVPYYIKGDVSMDKRISPISLWNSFISTRDQRKF